VLDVETYNTAESKAADALSNRVVQAFYPEIFVSLGYPIRVKHVGQLWRYIDVMHETRTHYNMTSLLHGLTREEFELFKRVTAIVDQHARQQYGRQAHASAALLRAIHALRLIRIVTGDERPTVLEIGPGCGYLAMLLVMEGYSYIGTEVVQAFYLYQSHMLAHVAKDLRELAAENGDITTIAQPGPGTAIHIPWWKWYTPDPSKVTVSAGIMTANHMLCEMHPYSMGYLSVLARQLLSNQAGGGNVVFESWGYPEIHSEGSVLQKFMEHGFRLCHNELVMSAMVLADHAESSATYDPDTVKAAPSVSTGLYAMAKHVPGLKAVAVPVLRRLPRFKQMLTSSIDEQKKAVRLPEFKSDHPLSRRLSEGHADVVARANVRESDLYGFLNSHFGTIPQHPDEAFFNLIGTRML
jgi:hypothetical protein